MLPACGSWPAGPPAALHNGQHLGLQARIEAQGDIGVPSVDMWTQACDKRQEQTEPCVSLVSISERVRRWIFFGSIHWFCFLFWVSATFFTSGTEPLFSGVGQRESGRSLWAARWNSKRGHVWDIGVPSADAWRAQEYGALRTALVSILRR